MSYEQLAASVDALAEANRSLTEQSLETQAGSIAASDNATAKALEAAQAALSAEDAARVATDAANLAKDSTDIMDSVEAGIAAGKEFFYTISGSNKEVLILWKNVGGVAVDTGKRTPSQASVAEVSDLIRHEESIILAVEDDAGYVGFETRDSSISTRYVSVGVDGIVMGDQTLKRTSDSSLSVVDSNGFIGLSLGNDGILKTSGLELADNKLNPTKDHALLIVDDNGFVGFEISNAGVIPSSSGGTPPIFSLEDVNNYTQKGLTSRITTLSDYNSQVARPIWEYNHILQYGQSLSTDFEGYPALSKVARLGNMMFGNSPRPASRANPEYLPVGGSAVLTPMKSVVQDSSTGATILTDDQVSALPEGSSNEGEASVVGMTNFAKLLHNQSKQVDNDTSKVFIASSCGVNGQTIEQLSKGHATGRWNRLTQAASKVKAIAVADSKSYGIIGVNFIQGEFNYSTNWGGVDTKDAYKAKMATLYSDIESDVWQANSGQTQPPLFMTYQTGASYTNDANDLAIGMAQWEMSKERKNWVLATPVYQFPDKGGHLTANSYRWMGKQFAKVWHKVVYLGQGWKPLSPINVVHRSDEMLVTFHVPCPPLVFDKPYVGRTATDYADKGFTVLDNNGRVDITSVQIVSDCVVKLKLSRSPVGIPKLRYADKTYHNGNGCLRDSDATICDDIYEYTAGSGQYADENIPSLVGKPYPLYNWCIAFHLESTGV